MPETSAATIDDVLIIGAGPAGLTAGYKLTQKSQLRVRLLEADPTYVGGISRTERYQGFSFDIGGHRFFSKSDEIEALWREILPNDFLLRPRLSRIFYQKKFYSYPLKAFEALWNLGLFESALCVLSYAYARIRPVKNPKTFAEWVSNQFGGRLFRVFFKTYTEKVWGMGCDELSADWAAQRIKGLNLVQAVWSSISKSLGLTKSKSRSETIKTLTEEFHYPRLGPGMMWEATARKIKAQGGTIDMGLKVTHLAWNATENLWSVSATDQQGQEHLFKARQIMSSAAMRDLVQAIEPAPHSSEQAKGLKYRDFITVALMLNKPTTFQDNWIYIHDPSVLVGRIQNFAAWSPDMVPTAATGCLGFEYFCFEGDALWCKTDDEMIALAKTELATLGLVDPTHVEGGCVVRQVKTYPVYDDVYADIVAAIRTDFAQNYPTLHFIGRNGMHKYDNQDHAMMTAILAAENVMAGKQIYDVWSVNEDAAYHEERSEEKKAS